MKTVIRYKPEILVCLGATAGRAVFGPEFRLLRERGRFMPSRFAPKTLAALHPSAFAVGTTRSRPDSTGCSWTTSASAPPRRCRRRVG